MDEESLRALVREAIARHTGTTSPAATRPPNLEVRGLDVQAPGGHASHYLYLHLSSGTDACLIEPAVECTHCGYCQSHGH